MAAESVPLRPNWVLPSSGVSSICVSVDSEIGRYAPSQYWLKSFETITQLKFWPGGSSASAPCPVWKFDAQNGLGGVGPSGL